MKWKCEECSRTECTYETNVKDIAHRCPQYNIEPDWQPVIEPGMWGKFEFRCRDKGLYGELYRIESLETGTMYVETLTRMGFPNFTPLEKPEGLE